MFDKIKDLFKPRPAIELGIDDISGFINREISAELSAVNERVNLMAEEIHSELSLLKNIFTGLNEKQDKNTFVNSVKNKFCSRSLELIEGVGKPEMTYNSLRNFLNKLKELTNGISNLGFKEMLHLRVFKEDMDNLANKTKLIIDRNKKLGDFLKGNGLLEKIAKIEDKIRVIKSYQNDVDNLDTAIRNEEDYIANLENVLKEKKGQLDEFLKSDRFLQLSLANKDLEELEKNKSILKQQIATEFSGIDKALKKFQHSGFANREEEKLINSYITDSCAFLSDDNLEIRVILEKVRQKIDSKDLDVEEKRYNKILYLLNGLDPLTATRNEYRKIEENITEKNKIKNELLPILDDRARKEREIEDIAGRIANRNEKKDNLLAEIKGKRDDIEAGRNNLESMVSDLLKRDVVLRL